jgi:heme/copper-type cytochrome/quinol oxidase subunit 4
MKTTVIGLVTAIGLLIISLWLCSRGNVQQWIAVVGIVVSVLALVSTIFYEVARRRKARQ